MTMARYKVFDAEVFGTGAVTSNAIDIGTANGYFSIGASLNTGTADISYQVSHDGVNYDTATAVASRLVHDDLTTAYTVAAFSPPVGKRMKIYCAGDAGNATTAAVTAWLMFDE